MGIAVMLILGSLLPSDAFLAAADVRDEAFRSLLKKIDPTLTAFSTIGSKHVTATLDVLLLLGRPTDKFSGNQDHLSRLGVFLQDRQHKDVVYLVGSEPEISSNCEPEIKVLTATDVVLGCGFGDYGLPVSKDVYLLYDIETRTILRHEKLRCGPPKPCAGNLPLQCSRQRRNST